MTDVRVPISEIDRILKMARDNVTECYVGVPPAGKNCPCAADGSFCRDRSIVMALESWKLYPQFGERQTSMMKQPGTIADIRQMTESKQKIADLLGNIATVFEEVNKTLLTNKNISGI